MARIEAEERQFSLLLALVDTRGGVTKHELFERVAGYQGQRPGDALERMFERADTLTRLGSTMSPSEMTIDPEFGFNAQMSDDVSNIHTARLIQSCDGPQTDWYTAARRLVLPDGTEILIPSQQWLDENGMTASEYLANLQEPAAMSVLYRAAWAEDRNIGDPEVLVQVLDAHGFDGQALLAGTADPAVKARLRANTERAVAAGICGVPTFVIDGEVLFWGQDRLDQVELALRGWRPTAG